MWTIPRLYIRYPEFKLSTDVARLLAEAILHDPAPFEITIEDIQNIFRAVFPEVTEEGG
jgi:hypothetical protein